MVSGNRSGYIVRRIVTCKPSQEVLLENRLAVTKSRVRFSLTYLFIYILIQSGLHFAHPMLNN